MSSINVNVELPGGPTTKLRWSSNSTDTAVAGLVCGAGISTNLLTEKHHHIFLYLLFYPFTHHRPSATSVGLPNDASIILRDSDGFLVPCCAQLSPGQSYVVVETPSASMQPQELRDSSVPPQQPRRHTSSATFQSDNQALLSELRDSEVPSRVSSLIDPILENRMTKFERLTSHLANERTFLAWVRTAVSVIGLAVTYSSLASHHDPAIFWTGCRFDPHIYVIPWSISLSLVLSSYAWLVGLAIFVVGTRRYYKVKEVLGLPKSAITNRFERTGINYIVGGFGIFLALMSGEYLHSLYTDMY